MHFYFLNTCNIDALPPSQTIDQQGQDLRVQTKRGVTFPSPIGIGPGLLTNGAGIDAILNASGTDSKTGLSTFIELGTCTPDRQVGRPGMPMLNLRIDLDKQTVKR